MRHNLSFSVLCVVVATSGCVSLKPHSDTDSKMVGAVAPTPAPVPAAAPEKGAAELPPPLAAKACLLTAEELDKRGAGSEAIWHYERARQLDPKLTQISARLAVAYGRGDEDQRALAEFEKAGKLHPKDADLLNNLGYFHVSREDWAAAERALNEAVRLKPDHARAWMNLAVVHANTGRVEESRKAFARVLQPAQVEYNLGVLLAGQGRTDDAKKCLQTATALDPQLLRAADLLKRMDNPQPASRITTVTHTQPNS